MATTIELSPEISAVQTAISQKVLELNQVDRKIKDMVGQMLDASPKDREALVKARFGLMAELGAIRDEIEELNRRKRAAVMAYCSEREEAAFKVLEESVEANRQARVALDEAMKALMNFNNHPPRGLAMEETDKQLEALEVARAKARTKSLIVGRELVKARAEYEQVKREHVEMLNDFGLGSHKEGVI